MTYGVTVVNRSDLPTGHDWVVIRRQEHVHVFLTSDAMSATTLAKAWAGGRMVIDDPQPLRRAG